MTTPEKIMLQKGKIIRYFQGKCYGFIQLEDGSEIFFHNTRQCTVLSDHEVPEITLGWTREAVQGEEVLAEVENSPKGKRAKYWVKASNYEKAQQIIKNRKTIRLVHRRGHERISRLQPIPERRTMYEGNSLRELRRLYPKHSFPTVTQKAENGYYFEELQQDGTWTRYIEDPR